MRAETTLLPLLAGLAAAWDAPQYNGWTRIWQDNFVGNAGATPSRDNWDIKTGYLNVNSELEVYSDSNQNLQLSGGGSVQLIPKNNNGQWTSARIESKYVFTPASWKKTKVEALFRFGGGDPGRKQGIWPAFWMLGDSIRHGTDWPKCGEIDILEQINGGMTAYSTVHCDVQGGMCHDPNGIQGSTRIPDQSWHKWSVVIDRTPQNWRDETLTFYRDDSQYWQIGGNSIPSEAVWGTLAHSPLFIIFNVAVGGQWVCNSLSKSSDNVVVKTNSADSPATPTETRCPVMTL
jgi:beta-glucanase (GH16 family)